MRYLLTQLLSIRNAIVMTVCTALFAAILYPLIRLIRRGAKFPWRWLFRVLMGAGLIVAIAWLPRRYPPVGFLKPTLPHLFKDYFWLWAVALGEGALLALIEMIRAIRAARAPVSAPTGDAAGHDDEVEAAWQEILDRFAEAQIELGRQRVYLILSPGEAWIESLVRSAGLPIFAKAPDGPAPIHAYATADGVLLSCAGASAFGNQEVQGSNRLKEVCRQLVARAPDFPPLRGVAVLFPMSWAAQPESVKWAAAIRDDLRAIRRATKILSPVYALFVEMETVPGFLEFIDRMPRDFLGSRVGFGVPGATAFSGELVQNGLAWMTGWFHAWILNRLQEDLLNQTANDELFRLDLEFRRSRKRLRAVLEAAFSSHREAEPVPFHGAYFLATGSDIKSQAFASGLLRGTRSRVIVGHLDTEWSEEAREDDRWYKQLALVVGAVGGFMILVAWLYLLRESQSSLWWLGLIALVIAWIVAGVRLRSW